MEQAQQEKAMKDNMNFLIDLATIATGIKQNKTYIGWASDIQESL